MPSASVNSGLWDSLDPLAIGSDLMGSLGMASQILPDVRDGFDPTFHDPTRVVDQGVGGRGFVSNAQGMLGSTLRAPVRLVTSPVRFVSLLGSTVVKGVPCMARGKI